MSMTTNPVQAAIQNSRAHARFASTLTHSSLATLTLCVALFGAMPWSLATAAEPTLTYTVRQKDKLTVLSKTLLTGPKAWQEVAKLNQLKDANVISPGQTLRIPLRLLNPQKLQASVLSATGDVSSVQGANLSEGTQIKVGANSSAVIELADKSKVKILPGTLLEVVQNRHYAMRDAGASISTTWFSGTVRVIQGAIEVLAEKTGRRATPLEVQLPTAVVGVRGTVFRAAHEGGLSRTEVLEGKVRADNPAQASGAEVPAGFGAVIDPKVKDIKAVSLLPAPDLSAAPEQLNVQGGDWKFAALPGAMQYSIQVASDAQFNAIVRDLKSPAPQANLATLPLGNWFVRARGVDAVGIEGFNAAKRLALVSPAPAAVIAPPAPLFPTAVVSSVWLSSKDGISNLKLPQLQGDHTQTVMTMAKDASMKDVIFSKAVTDSSVDLGKLASGTYFLQFKGVYSDGRANQSVVYKMFLDENWGHTVFNSFGSVQPYTP